MAAFQAAEGARHVGIVHWYHRDRDYGWITYEDLHKPDAGPDLFVQGRHVEYGDSNRRYLREGDHVSFEVFDGDPRGPQARNVLLLAAREQ